MSEQHEPPPISQIKRVEVIREGVDGFLAKWWEETEHRLDYELTEYDNGAPLTAETKGEFFAAAIEALRQLANELEEEGQEEGWIAQNLESTATSRSTSTARGRRSTTAASVP